MQSVWVGNVAWSLDGGIVSLHSHCSPNARESGILENLAGKIRNPGLWNLEYSSRNTESHERLESRILGPLKKNENLVPSFRNPQRGIQNPRLSWISLFGVILNTLKCVLPTSFRAALLCNYPALCSLYASRVGFETVRILIIICCCFRILVL